jgi:hypothetical protein
VHEAWCVHLVQEVKGQRQSYRLSLLLFIRLWFFLLPHDVFIMLFIFALYTYNVMIDKDSILDPGLTPKHHTQSLFAGEYHKSKTSAVLLKLTALQT